MLGRGCHNLRSFQNGDSREELNSRDPPRQPLHIQRPRILSYGDFVTRIYVHTPERFEFRQVAVGQTFGNLVQVTNGLHDGERVVVLGKGPRQ
jgi:hypothetical protein